MENNRNPWVDERLSALDPSPAWEPDSAAAWMRLRRRERDARVRRRWWFALAAAAACVAVAAVAIGHRPFRGSAQPVQTVSLRESGPADAPVRCEMYSDYGCGHCASVYQETLPQFVAGYVQTGKVRLVHRDLPLPSHPYARTAARYANAAARLGRYDLVAAQIFRSQASWGATGDLDAALMAVLPPADLAKLRALVKNPDLDLAIDVDVELARLGRITELPALVCVVREKRRMWAPVPAYSALKVALDEMLGTNCREGATTVSC